MPRALIVVLVVVAAVGAAILGLLRSMRVSETLVRLQDTTAEIRVRGAFLLMTLFVVLADRFGLEAILGAFLAGATLKLVDRDEGMTHAFFHGKLEAVGFGVFIPFFFVSTGMKLDVSALVHSSSALARVPVRKDVAMTGEITLRGKVLPIGGVKEKVLAAHRAGVKNIVLPKDNEKDLADIPKNVLDTLNVYMVQTMDEVLKIALTEPLAGRLAAEGQAEQVDSAISDDTITH